MLVKSKESAFVHVESALMIFSGLIRADGKVSQRELSYIQKYLNALYPDNISKYLFEKFEKYLITKLSMEEIAKKINRTYNYETKVFLMYKTYEIMVADGIALEEASYLRRLANYLEIRKSDLKYLELVFEVGNILEPLPNRKAKEGPPVIQDILIGSEPETCDVISNDRLFHARIVNINRHYYIKVIKSVEKVFLATQQVSPNFLTFIPADQWLCVGNLSFCYTDFNFFFKLKKTPFRLNQKSFFLYGSDHQRLLSHSRNEALAEMSFKNLSLRIDMISPLAKMVVNGSAALPGQFLNLNDDFIVNGNTINLRNIFYENVRCVLNFNESPVRIGNRNGQCDLVLEDDSENEWWLGIEKRQEVVEVVQNGCPHPLVSNGRVLPRKCTVQHGESLFIHHNELKIDAIEGHAIVSPCQIKTFSVDRLSFTANGCTRVDQLSFHAQLGDLICIMGPSGSGKTTLLNLLVGLQRPTKGSVSVDQLDLHKHWPFLRKDLGYVPQDDYLFKNLTAQENLLFSAALRFPSKSREELHQLVLKTLGAIGLCEIADQIVGDSLDNKMSGGQRKRLNIGLELLSNASIYFFDEPTSGLSSFDSNKILNILKSLASEGKIVFSVIHQPDSDLYKKFNKLILIDKGGKLAFFGDTKEAIAYFKNHSFEADSHDQAECPQCKRLNPNLLLDGLEECLQNIDGSLIQKRKYTPEYWQSLFAKRSKHQAGAAPSDKKLLKRLYRQKPSASVLFANFKTLLHRNLKVKVRNRSNLILTFFLGPFLALLCSVVLKYSKSQPYTLNQNSHLDTFFFVTVIIVIFLGIANSVEDIIKERHILKREKLFDISVNSFYLSKLLTLLAFAAMQNALFIAISFAILEIRELYFLFWLLLMVVSLVGIGIGLFISSMPWLTSKAAFNVVPLVLIPQIILGGALIDYKEMNKDFTYFEENPIPEICQLMPSRWAFEAAIVGFDTFNSFQGEENRLLERWRTLGDQLEKVDDEAHPPILEQRASLEEKIRGIPEKLAAHRETWEERFGNVQVHEIVSRGDDQLKASGKRGVYALGVSQKNLPWMNRPVNTLWYNMLILTLGFLAIAGLNVALLKTTL